MPNYIYAQKENNIYVNLFVPSSTSFETEKGRLKLTQKSNMPWDGNISIILQPKIPEEIDIHIRIPGWASKNPVPGDLYKFKERTSAKPVFKLNGREISPKMENGYAVISKTWNEGDLIEVGFPYEIRKIEAHPNIEDDVDKMALQLGPLVYCTEWADFDDPDILSLVLNEETKLNSEFIPELLGGVNVITGDAEGTKKANGSDDIITYPRKFKAIPYYAWSHRGKGQMAVWIATKKEVARAKPKPTIASKSTIEASLKIPVIMGINDQLIPKNSADKTNTLYHWWPKTSETHWIIYQFESPAKISETEIYWLKDIPDGGCSLPEWWKLYYKSGNNWVEVKGETPYPIIENDWNKLVFEPVTTSAIKLEVQLSKEYSAGIHEWVVK